MVLIYLFFLVISVVVDAVDTYMFTCRSCTFFHFMFAGTVRTGFFSFAFIVFMVIHLILYFLESFCSTH